MKQLLINMVLWATVMAGLHACSPNNTANSKRIPSLVETYKYDDTRPFGAYAAHQLLQAMYPMSPMSTPKETIEEARKNSYDTGALYVAIAESFFTSEEDVTAIKNYVRSGNDMLVAASEFDDNLLDEIGCSFNSNNIFQRRLRMPMMNTAIKLDTAYYDDTAAYSFFYQPFNNYFTSLPKGESVVLGRNEGGRPNFVVFFIGNGRLFLHSEPRAFSNYFLLQKNNYQYLRQAMTYTRNNPEKIIWNDYYNNIHSSRGGKDQDGSLFDGLKGGLLVAFCMLLALILLYIIDGTKRRQRVIPIRKPNENTTVTFAETVGLLYLQKKDNKNIADKMVTYFNEFIRNQYFLNTNHPTNEFITTLSRKSGVPQDKVEALYRTMGHAQLAHTIDDYQLLSLNQQIQNFYKHRN